VIGKKLSNRYEITGELGRGGMGVVYRARDPLLDREVAIKLIPPTMLNPETEQRFQHEAKLVAQMDHPAIVSIFDFGYDDGSLFFVMPIVKGTTLSSILRENTLSLGEVIDIGIKVAEALDYSHVPRGDGETRGVVHRDIKPDNIMVLRDEDGLRVRVMDFGVARIASEERITKTGTIIGTPAYLSPEQVAAKNVDSRSDIYSLGVVLYECAVGQPPFTGDIQSILYRIVNEFPQPPRSVGASIDLELEQLILDCLAKDPAKRPQRASDVAAALRRYRERLRDGDRSLTLVLTRTLKVPKPALPTFVGRAKELAELQQQLNAAVAGECQFLVVAGEPGIGKTRLLDEIENLAKARKIRVLHGRFVEQDRSFPYQGFFEAIQEYFRLKETGDSTPGVTDLSDLAGDLVALFPMLKEIDEIRAATTGNVAAGLSAERHALENRTEIFELLARTLTRIAGGRPLVLLLEDLHGGQVSIEALPYIVRRLGPTPTLIIGTYRSTEVDKHHPLSQMLDSFRGDRHFSLTTLGPFSPSEHRLYLQTLVGGPELGNSLVEKLYDGTEGNPFFTKEMVRSLMDSGGIAKDDTGAWNLTGETGLATDSLPATIQQVVERRIERLPEDLRDVLSVASVMGKTFDYRDLEMLMEGKGDVEDAIDRLILDGLIEEERESRGDRLTFSSGVVRDVLYAEIPRRRRRTLHRKYAEHIEKRHEGRLERVYPLLVYHYSQADIGEKSVEFALRLARASLEAFSPEEATRAVKTALQFLDEEWEGNRWREGEARMLLAQAYRMTGDIDGALREVESANKIFEREEHSAYAVTTLLLAAEIAWQARRSEETRRWVERGMAAARAAGDTENLRHLLSLAATLANLLGDYQKANDYADEVARLVPETDNVESQEEIPQGGTLVVALANPVNTLEPVLLELVEEGEILTNVFEPLVATDQEGNLIPNLCEKWEMSEKGRTVLLTLRGDIRFQDGHLLKAEDVKKSFERAIRQPSAELPPALSAISGVSEFVDKSSDDVSGIVVHSENRLEIQLIEPLSIYPALLTDTHTGITRVAKNGAGDSQVYGTGPFQIATHTSERIVLQRNANHWKGNPPRLDAVEFRPGLNATNIASGLRSGEYDIARDLLPKDLDEVLRDPRFRRGLVETPKKNTYFALFNIIDGAAAQNPLLRRALSGVVRTHELVWQTLGRFAQPAACLIPPGMLGHDPGKRRDLLTQDEALEMLRTSGVTSPIKLTASLHPIFRDRYAALLTALFSLWAELGVEVIVQTNDMSAYLESFQHAAGIDLFIGRWSPDYDDPDNFSHYLFHSRAGILRGYFSSAEADRILDDARAEGRARSREAHYRKFDSLLNEAGALIPLFHDIDYRIASPKIRGLKLRSTPPHVNYSELGKVEASVQPTEVPRNTGGILHIPLSSIIENLDPAYSATLEQVEVVSSIFETLLFVGGSRIVAGLAADFKVEGDGKKYHFRLRDDVRFHDGRRVTARDVRYSFERLLGNHDSESRWLYSSIRGAKALLSGEAGDLAGFRIHSALEFTIELDEPVSFFPALLTFSAVSIIPEGSEQFSGTWQQGCVGTGPFRVAKYEAGRFMELEANKNYWRKGFPKTDGLIYEFGISPVEILKGFKAGRFALASDLFPADVEALRREPAFAAGYRETPRLSTYYIAFNIHRGPLSHRSFRQGLVGSVDVAAVVRRTLGRMALPAHGFIPPGLIGHNPMQTPRVTYPTTPVATAPEVPIELRAAVNPVYFREHSTLLTELSRAFREHNVKIESVNKTLTEFDEHRHAGSADLLVTRWIADYPDADTFVHLLHSQEGFIGRFCGTAEVDRLIERGRAETSPLVRHTLYHEIEEIIAREVLVLPLFYEQAYRFARPEVEGLSVSFWGQTVDYASLQITT
jgi:ABC-type transport system substrate-binding protein